MILLKNSTFYARLLDAGPRTLNPALTIRLKLQSVVDDKWRLIISNQEKMAKMLNVDGSD